MRWRFWIVSLTVQGRGRLHAMSMKGVVVRHCCLALLP